MAKIDTNEIFQVDFPMSSGGSVMVKCFSKHFVNGRLISRREISLRKSRRNLRGNLRGAGELDEQGGVVQFVWQVKINIFIADAFSKSMTTGNGEIVQSIEYSPPDSRGRVRLRPVRRSRAMPRTSGHLDIGFSVDPPEGRISGARATFNSAFEISFSEPRSSGAVTLGPISFGGQGNTNSSSIFCTSDAGFTVAR